MAGTIVADTLTHSTAGSIATNYVVEGSAKAWVHYTGTGTQVIDDSLNTSGITDGGTGLSTVAFSSSLANSNYAFTFGGARSSTPNEMYYAAANDGILVGSLKLQTWGGSTVTAVDASDVTFIVSGELA
jgi:hypothetical protein